MLPLRLNGRGSGNTFIFPFKLTYEYIFCRERRANIKLLISIYMKVRATVENHKLLTENGSKAGWYNK